ncbi:dienelactone hydrolase family protein [Nonomuraea roseoviolacea]|uniref:Dienelactone hydrolase n=1 Tax=Nonomuraea roseoviolacea subsp. carminata TaxID=160689 RepID=A0ABT1KDQ2_9ACTN|nr:hypothetical protein [Nonomuraea roseoviolacea]MCP2351744.1 dienelactone hydrolase [Nonomuraea roseoviolacea subsp. carminata]
MPEVRLPEVRLPRPSGPHPAGVRDIEAGPLLMRVWYPAAADAAPPRPYAAGSERDLLLEWTARRNPAWPPATTTALLAAALTHDHRDAPALPGPHPTIVFSHGADLYPGQNTALMTELASHGYVAVSVLQRGGGFAARPDGSRLESGEPLFAAAVDLFARLERLTSLGADPDARHDWYADLWENGRIVPLVGQWRDRMIAVGDALAAATPDGPFGDLAGVCDLARLTYMGMSLGGSAAVSAAQADPRARAAVNLDGMHLAPDLFGRPARVPVLGLYADFQGAGHHSDLFYEEFGRTGLRGDVVRVKVADAAHRDFTDLALLPGKQRLDHLGSVDGEGVTRLVGALTLAFLDRFVEGGTSGALPLGDGAELIDVSHVRAWRGRGTS